MMSPAPMPWLQGLVRPGSTPPVVDLFLELAQPHEALPPYNPSTDMLILIKVYRGASASQPLECKGHLVASRPMPLRVQFAEELESCPPFCCPPFCCYVHVCHSGRPPACACLLQNMLRPS